MAPFLKQDLATGWEFKLADDTNPDAWLPVAKVPSVVHMDLVAHNKIPDASVDFNEVDVQWVGEANWSYRCTFVPEAKTSLTRKDNDDESSRRIHLVFEGLDTFATVYLNGKQILECDNMFVAHRVDVTDSLTDGENILLVNFESAARRGREIVAVHPEHTYIGTLGSHERMAVRKAQYHWGWDWGPALVTAGPWRPVRLEMFDSRIQDLDVKYFLGGPSRVDGAITTRVNGITAGTQVKTRLIAPDNTSIFSVCHDVDLTGEVRVPFAIADPKLWYPRGYGAQDQHMVEVELWETGVKVHARAQRVGFRMAVLVNEEDSVGKSFYFRINGIDIFSGGSCWIPADMLPPQVTEKDYRAWLEMMVEGNQIMTRIWGGGYYEDAAFYDICDELGILVWQDFMFACGSYPANPAFLKSVELEARQALRKLSHHPSIVIWAGGNENHFIQEHCKLEYDWEDKDPQSWLRTSFPSRYIFQYLLPLIVDQEMPGMCYRPDSPWNDGRPIMSWDRTTGDLHQWNVWHAEMRLYQDFAQIGGRFNSEFGMQSLPHLSTIHKFISESTERHPQSAVMDYHNKCRDHEKRLATYVRDNFKAVDSSLESWVYLTHLLQAEAMHYAYRSWRRDWNRAGERHCGGALVWQMNDLWPVTSWALVDSARLKKAAFYTIKRDLAPITVGVVRTHHDWTKAGARPPAECTYDAWIACNGSVEARQVLEKGDLEIELRFISIHTGEDILPKQTQKISSSKINANGTTLVHTGVSLTNPKSRDELYVISTLVRTSSSVLAQDVDWPQPFKHISFRNERGLRVKREAEGNKTRLTITSSRPTKGLIFTEKAGLAFSDNCLDIVPGETYSVFVEGLNEEKDDYLEWTYLGKDEYRGVANGNGVSNGNGHSLNGNGHAHL